MARGSWAIDAFVGAVFKRRGGASLGMGRGFNSAENELQFCFEKGMIFGTIGPRSGHDRPTIAPRSGHNLSPGRSSVIVLSSGSDSAAEGATIAARSRRDRTVLPPIFAAVRFESDAPDLLQE